MAFLLKDRVLETTTSTGTGSLNLAGAVTGYQDFDTALSDADTTCFIIEAVDSSGVPTGAWEAAYGTFTSAGTTLSRDRVYDSSNSGSAVSFAAGTKNVFIFRPAILGAYVAYNYNLTFGGGDEGTFTAGSWQTRLFNTEVSDEFGLGSLSSNQITLAEGTYRVRWACPAYDVGINKTRLQNVTDGTTVDVLGRSTYGNASATVEEWSISMGEGEFTIGASKALELQHQCTTTSSTTAGNGVVSGFNGGNEVFSTIEFWRVN